MPGFPDQSLLTISPPNSHSAGFFVLPAAGTRLDICSMIDEILLPEFARQFAAKLTQAQGDAVKKLLVNCNRLDVTDLRQIAYILATCWHECRFKSIREIRARKGTTVWQMQEMYWHTGFYGRGFSQLTWKRNYDKFGKLLGIDLVNNPDLALDPDIGAKILVMGMRDGLFSGKKLSDYFTRISTDWLGARRIVNGTFQNDRVADAAMKIFGILCLPAVAVEFK